MWAEDPPEPNDFHKQEDCHVIWASGAIKSGTWNDDNCEIQYGYICESKITHY